MTEAVRGFLSRVQTSMVTAYRALAGKPKAAPKAKAVKAPPPPHSKKAKAKKRAA